MKNEKVPFALGAGNKLKILALCYLNVAVWQSQGKKHSFSISFKAKSKASLLHFTFSLLWRSHLPRASLRGLRDILNY
jgi:hypothetical protein